ncbi:hypothetical protein GYMLUDRAFT_80218 [Collybiopsis luxurians FD-317 M1]|nr:hypothetical protein GYMLUDRAFT_80218 [Collybiopsis luxurians FD-317 M1]
MTPHCPVCERTFHNPGGLRSHLRKSSRAHFICSKCDGIFGDDQALKEHMKSKHAMTPQNETPYKVVKGESSIKTNSTNSPARERHSTFSTPTRRAPRSISDESSNSESTWLYCQPCQKKFEFQNNLQEHFRGSPAHPNCEVCGKGFFNKQMCEDHCKEAHPFVCKPCNVAFSLKRDLSKHYYTSPSHPSCRVCKVGFVDDEGLDQHFRKEHGDTRCQQCQRQYDSLSELQHHFLASKKHPTCTICDLGFENDEEHEKHYVSLHSESDIQSPLDDKSSSGEDKGVGLPEVDSRELSPAQLNGSVSGSPIEFEESSRSSVWSSCVFPDETVAGQGVDLDESFIVSKAKWEATKQDAAETAVETTAKNTANYLLLEDQPSSNLQLALRPQSFWTVNPPSRPSGEVSSPEVCSPVGLEDLPSISPDPSTPVSQSTIAPAFKDPWPQWGSEVANRPPLPQINTGLKGKQAALESVRSSISTTLDQSYARYGFKPNDSLLALEGHDFLSSLRDSPISFNTSKGLPRSDAWSSQFRPAVQQRIVSKQLATPTPTLSTSVTSTSTDRSITEPSLSPATTVASWGFHCRLCMQDPCTDCTATICGHLFCEKCITESVISSSKCPVCDNALLLYCLFKLDLSH